MTVISFQAKKAERDPHWSGKCKCLGCGHEWVGVGPIGVMIVDCPSCNLPKGHIKHLFGPQEGDSVFQCMCGSEALTAYYNKGQFRLVCMACGIDQSNAIYGEP